MDKRRNDPLPDPFAKQPTELTRNPGRGQPKTVVVDSTRPTNRMRAHVHFASGAVAIPTITDTVLLFDTTDFDTVGLYTSGRFTMPSTGKVTSSWLLHAHVTWDGDVAGTFRKMWIRQNGVTALRTAVSSPVANPSSLSVTALINDPKPTDYFQVVVRHNAGHDVNIFKDPDQAFFSIIHLW